MMLPINRRPAIEINPARESNAAPRSRSVRRYVAMMLRRTEAAGSTSLCHSDSRRWHGSHPPSQGAFGNQARSADDCHRWRVIRFCQRKSACYPRNRQLILSSPAGTGEIWAAGKFISCRQERPGKSPLTASPLVATTGNAPFRIPAGVRTANRFVIQPSGRRGSLRNRPRFETQFRRSAFLSHR